MMEKGEVERDRKKRKEENFKDLNNFIFEKKTKMNNSFQIFERNTRLLNPTKGNILFLLMIASLLIFTQFKEIQDYTKYPAVLLTIVYVIYHSTEFTRFAYLNGKFIGTLIINKDNVIINERKIGISEIKNTYLRANDYEGRIASYSRGVLPMSNGTNNLLTLNLKTGEIIKTFFKIENEYQGDTLNPFIISLLKNKIINFERAVEFLNLGSDYAIEQFEKELNKKEPE